MSAPTTSFAFTQTTPAATTGDQNAVIQSDGATPQQSISMYPKRMVGDSGAGGLAGTVPPPAAGDAVAGKYLKADGTWASILKARSVTFKLTAVGPSDPIVMNYGATIVGWSIIANTTTTASVDLWFVAGSAPPSAPVIPVGANKISASAAMALTAAQTAAGGSSAISTWTKPISQWGTMMANATALPALATVMVQVFLIET